jgi:hypothetical protein
MRASARCVGLCIVGVLCLCVPHAQAHPAIGYRLERVAASGHDLRQRFSEVQLGILEKLNRADRDHLGRLGTLVVPDVWVEDDLAYSGMPASYAAGASLAKLLVLHLPGQMFGGYESGRLVRWGPISSGRRTAPTPQGLFHLNWRSAGRTSTVDPDWFMPWYYNFDNRRGLSLHEYSLPGRPASHRCVRLLSHDAQWLFRWGDSWTLDPTQTRVVRPGTPVFIVGVYDFNAPPPWQSMEWLGRPVELPRLPGTV